MKGVRIRCEGRELMKHEIGNKPSDNEWKKCTKEAFKDFITL